MRHKVFVKERCCCTSYKWSERDQRGEGSKKWNRVDLTNEQRVGKQPEALIGRESSKLSERKRMIECTARKYACHMKSERSMVAFTQACNVVDPETRLCSHERRPKQHTDRFAADHSALLAEKPQCLILLMSCLGIEWNVFVFVFNQPLVRFFPFFFRMRFCHG